MIVVRKCRAPRILRKGIVERNGSIGVFKRERERERERGGGGGGAEIDHNVYITWYSLTIRFAFTEQAVMKTLALFFITKSHEYVVES